MRRSLLHLAALAGLAVAAHPAAAHAQRRPVPPTDAARTAAAVDDWIGEIERLHARLESLQLRALDDPRVSAARSRLGDRIKLAMERADPTLQRDLGRMEAMETEVAAARRAGDAAALRRLAAEADRIRRDFGALHARVLRQPEIRHEVDTFQDHLQRTMVALDPDAGRVIDRFRQLESRLAAVSGSGAP